MPFTPFHFGPGVLFKSAARGKFSLVTFLVSQVIIDLETLINILFGAPRLHTFFHSYVGATCAAFTTCALILKAYQINDRFKFFRTTSCPFFVIFGSALIGSWSHVFLDSIMHSDLQPYWPFSEENQLLRIVSLSELHLACVLTGVLGMIIWSTRGFRK